MPFLDFRHKQKDLEDLVVIQGGKDNWISFNMPDNMIPDADDPDALVLGNVFPWICFCKHNTDEVVPDMWCRGNPGRMPGFDWPASAIPPAGNYTMWIVLAGEVPSFDDLVVEEVAHAVCDVDTGRVLVSGGIDLPPGYFNLETTVGTCTKRRGRLRGVGYVWCVCVGCTAAAV